MRKIIKHISILILFMLTFTSITIANAASPNWYWISSNDKYSKFFATNFIRITHKENNIPTTVEDWVKTNYSLDGARETIKNMKLPIANPADLSYSIATVQLNPQARTICYLDEIFYDKNGKALYRAIPAKPIHKDINSRSFDEKFYTMIIDRVFNQGETSRLSSKTRWLNLWNNDKGTASADTATIRRIGNNVIVWIWQENKNNTTISSIQFMKKEYNLKTGEVRTIRYDFWSPKTNWVDRTATDAKGFHNANTTTTELAEFTAIKAFANRYPKWSTRYQLIQPTPLVKPTASSPKSTKPAPPESVMPISPSGESISNGQASSNNNKPAKANSQTPDPNENLPIGSVGPIGAPIK